MLWVVDVQIKRIWNSNLNCNDWIALALAPLWAGCEVTEFSKEFGQKYVSAETEFESLMMYSLTRIKSFVQWLGVCLGKMKIWIYNNWIELRAEESERSIELAMRNKYILLYPFILEFPKWYNNNLRKIKNSTFSSKRFIVCFFFFNELWIFRWYLDFSASNQ